MLFTPAADACVVGLFQANPHGAQVICLPLCRIRTILIPEVGQVGCKIIAEYAIHVRENVRRAGQAAPAATQHRRFVGKHRQNRFAKMITKLLGKAIVDELNKAIDRVGIQNVGRWRSILAWPFTLVMQTSNHIFFGSGMIDHPRCLHREYPFWL